MAKRLPRINQRIPNDPILPQAPLTLIILSVGFVYSQFIEARVLYVYNRNIAFRV